MTVKDTLATHLRRDVAGVSVKALATELQVKHRTLKTWELGAYKVDPKVARSYLDWLDFVFRAYVKPDSDTEVTNR
jgi:hypothetical protein